ncbi:hypothetical protein FRB94_008595 [Tulasnella sp. JGI-2019a]|nr:hypothetical protein FRB94_008595 [Tulasnella sp. JGI-2019a]KAG9002409.1 hypothetical protein FRB93_011526 [Tulasnella sp. JGI-2019a]
MLSEDTTFGDGPYALTLPEILLTIFGMLDARNLINAALVCKLWTWPAIDVGWRTCLIRLSSILAPLLKCEPSLLRSRDQSEAWSEAEEGEISAERWRKYQLDYGTKVTLVAWDVHPDASFNDRLEELMGSQRGPICPRLRNLTLSVHAENDGEEDINRWSPLLSLLIGPTLGRVRLGIGDVTKRVVNESIETLARVVPRLQHVFIDNGGEFSINSSAFRYVKSLKVQGHINHADWRSLADCLQLERIVLWEDASDIEIQRQDYSVTLPHLQALSVGDCCGYRSADFIVTLFRNTTMPLLRTLEVKIQERDVGTRSAAKNDILGFVRGRSPMLKEVVINGSVPGYDGITCRSLGHYVDFW